jgi:hypothetical protein
VQPIAKDVVQGKARFQTVSDKKRQTGSTTPGEAAPVVITKTRLPADARGTWLSGTKGEGIFRYNHSLENQKAGIAGIEVRFKGQYIAIGGFPPEAYYNGNAANASVEIGQVTGKAGDNAAADNAMRERLRDPSWRKPDGYRWNHAGPPSSKVMELVNEQTHAAVAHKGSASRVRAQNRTGSTSRAIGALAVYLLASDALRVAGVLKPSYEVAENEVYQFRANDGSVFVVNPGGVLRRGYREFIGGPRKGQRESITPDEAEEYRERAEEEFGKYVPGTPFTDPRFMPGKQRKTLPLITYPDGVPHEAGWIDDKGPHYYEVPRPIPT